MLFAVLFYTTFLSDHVLGSCHWSGWGTCYPPFFLWSVSPRAALEYSAIMTDISKTNSEKQAALEAWASNQSPAVLVILSAIYFQDSNACTRKLGQFPRESKNRTRVSNFGLLPSEVDLLVVSFALTMMTVA